MIKGKKYYCSFNVSASDAAQCYTNNIGISFSMDSVFISNFAHINILEIITDTSGWIRLFSSFIADTTYNYLILGNFFNDSLTDTICWGANTSAYYYIDDVCVSLDSLTCTDIKQQIVDISADTTNIFEGSCVKFFANTTVEYDFYNWLFPGAIQNTSTDSAPANICYDTAGVYDIVMIASTNKGCADTVIKSNYITVNKHLFIHEQYKEYQNELLLFPNPATETISFLFSHSAEINQLTIYDVCGRIMYHNGSKNFKQTIDVSAFNPGFYLIDIKSQNRVFQNKLLITPKL